MSSPHAKPDKACAFNPFCVAGWTAVRINTVAQNGSISGQIHMHACMHTMNRGCGWLLAGPGCKVNKNERRKRRITKTTPKTETFHLLEGPWLHIVQHITAQFYFAAHGRTRGKGGCTFSSIPEEVAKDDGP